MNRYAQPHRSGFTHRRGLSGANPYSCDPGLGFSLKKALKKVVKVAVAPLRLPLSITKAVIRNPLNPVKQVRAVTSATKQALVSPFTLFAGSGGSAPSAAPETAAVSVAPSPLYSYDAIGPTGTMVAPQASAPGVPSYYQGLPSSPMEYPGVPTSPENEAAAVEASTAPAGLGTPVLIGAGILLFLLATRKKGRA